MGLILWESCMGIHTYFESIVSSLSEDHIKGPRQLPTNSRINKT